MVSSPRGRTRPGDRLRRHETCDGKVRLRHSATTRPWDPSERGNQGLNAGSRQDTRRRDGLASGRHVMNTEQFLARYAAAVRCFREASLPSADLHGRDLPGIDLRGADLRGADFQMAVLRGAILARADLRRADLRGADLGGADLHGADLRGANLGEAALQGADLSGARMK